MSKTYVIADIHGRLDLLQMAYTTVLGCEEEPGLIVHLGDYVDRGPESRGVIDFLMTEETLPSAMWKRVVLKGNHEAMMVETLRKPLNPAWWVRNGGARTLYSYGHPYDPTVVPQEHLDFLDGLPRFFCDKMRVYCHAAVDESLSLPEQKDDTILWGLYRDGDHGGYRGAHVVHGHHQQDGKALLRDGRTNLDGGAWYTGVLLVGVFDNDLRGGPTKIIEVRE